MVLRDRKILLRRRRCAAARLVGSAQSRRVQSRYGQTNLGSRWHPPLTRALDCCIRGRSSPNPSRPGGVVGNKGWSVCGGIARLTARMTRDAGSLRQGKPTLIGVARLIG